MKKSQIRSRVRTLLENYMEGEKPEMNEEMMSPEDIAAMTFMDMNDDSVQFEARGRTSSIFAINDEQAVLLDPSFEAASPEERRTKIADFINRVNEIIIAKKRFAPGQKRPTKAFSKDDLTRLLALFTDEEGFTSKDVVDAVESYKNVQQANAFLKALEMKGYIKLTNFDDKTGKFFDPKKKSALAPEDEFDADLKDLAGLGGDIDLSDPLMEAKQPSKLKEIEAKGKMAALEAKLGAINEMIENITSSLTRLEEDDTMAEMMDKTKMKEMRKEVKLLERMKAKVEKEKAKMEGKYGKKEVVDEDTIEENINEERQLTYNDFVRMVRDDMNAGAAPDEYVSDERIKADAKYYYNRYLQGEKVEDMFESINEGLINENQMHDELVKLVMRYVKDPDDAFTQTDLIITGDTDEVDDAVRANLERDPDYKAWAKRFNAALSFDKSLRNLNESKSRMQKLAGIIKG